jgi:hypothetical protein
MDEWKPIDEAPHDTLLLVFEGPAGPPRLGHYNTYLKGWVDQAHRPIKPTLYTELPPLPFGREPNVSS